MRWLVATVFGCVDLRPPCTDGGLADEGSRNHAGGATPESVVSAGSKLTEAANPGP